MIPLQQEMALEIASAVTELFEHFEGKCTGFVIRDYTPPSLETIRILTTARVYEKALRVLGAPRAEA